MNRRLIQIATICMVLCLTVLCIPSSYSKFATTDNFVLNVKMSAVKKFYNTTSTSKVTTNSTSSSTSTPPIVQTFTIEKSGYYALVAKGGDGADGYKVAGSSVTYAARGGLGGTVAGVIYLNKDDIVTMYPGGFGLRATIDTSGIMTIGCVGNGGKNAEKPGDTYLYSGGKGGEDSGGAMASLLSQAVAGSGGGAATTVYIKAKGSSSNTLVMIAGGGGGGASWDAKSTVSSYVKDSSNSYGGAGGTNISTSKTTYNSANNGKVYSGSNGNGYSDSTYHAYGTGGSDTYGEGGYLPKEQIRPLMIKYTILSLEGSDGSVFGSYGIGGDANQFGGGGGGGYCGGGGGTGSTINKTDGGGGGGSSYIINTFNGKSVDVSTLNQSDVDGLISESSGLPTQNSTTSVASDNVGDGYVILKYLHD